MRTADSLRDPSGIISLCHTVFMAWSQIHLTFTKSDFKKLSNLDFFSSQVKTQNESAFFHVILNHIINASYAGKVVLKKGPRRKRKVPLVSNNSSQLMF